MTDWERINYLAEKLVQNICRDFSEGWTPQKYHSHVAELNQLIFDEKRRTKEEIAQKINQ